MDSTRRTALVAGLFYLITFAASIPALFLLAPVLNHVGYIVSPAAGTRVLWGCLGFRPSPITARIADPMVGV